MKIDVTSQAAITHSPTTLICPHCRTRAVFDVLPQSKDLTVNPREQITTGQRKCPNPECNGHVFIVRQFNKLAAIYPPTRIDFNADGIPGPIVKSLEEAITCEANDCYVAAAIMVRRTLEEICADQGAEGTNLKTRIQNLSDKIVVPKALKDAMDELRLLGNDAAHIEAKEYDDVSKEEVAVAIEFAKEMLKAIYQYKSLLDKMLGLKKKPTEE